jgi:hypothetical protein
MRPLQPITSAAPEAFYQCVCECELDATGVALRQTDAHNMRHESKRLSRVCVCVNVNLTLPVLPFARRVCACECELDAAGVAQHGNEQANMRHESKRLSRVCVCVNAKRV